MPRPPLPASFLRQPLAHRARHDRARGVIENSPSAIRAAVAEGYGIEIDVQLTADGRAIVFHDATLERLTGVEGLVRDKTLAEMEALPLLGAKEGSASLEGVLRMVSGDVPLLIELKDQSDGRGAALPELEQAVASAVVGYDGPIAVMSFNPMMVAAMEELAPDVPRGLTTCDYRAESWPDVPEPVRASLRRIEQFDRVGASFISHDWRELDSPSVALLKTKGIPILCWTVKSAKDEAIARRVADQITFEGYTPEPQVA